jgi:hypothetical protein
VRIIENITEYLGFATLKMFNTNLYKLTYSKHAKGKHKSIDKGKKGGEIKMAQAVSRARSKVYEYAICNDWRYFITLTLNRANFHRDNLDQYHKALTYLIKRLNAHRENKITFLLVPELHKDKKSWHIHGLINGLTPHDLCINQHGYLDWPEYSSRFGYCSLSPIKSHEAVSKYILKYIGKGFNERKVGEHLYYCSRGLRKAELVGVGHLEIVPSKWDYENEHVSVLWVENNKAEQYITN